VNGVANINNKSAPRLRGTHPEFAQGPTQRQAFVAKVTGTIETSGFFVHVRSCSLVGGKYGRGTLTPSLRSNREYRRFG
jgi:hypothetical protein